MSLLPEDYHAIRNLYGVYATAIDSGDIDAAMSTFAPHAIVVYEGLPVGLDRNGRHSGLEAIRALTKDVADGTAGHVMHLELPQTIDGDGDEAHVRLYAQIFRRGQAPFAGTILTDVAEDTLVKVDGSWLVTLRVGHMDSENAVPASTDVLVNARDRFVEAGAQAGSPD